MKILLWLVCAVAALASVSGCARKGLEGTWTRSESTRDMTVRSDMAFTSDGKYHETLSVAKGADPVNLERTGTWVAKGDQLTMSQMSATINGQPLGKQTSTEVFAYKRDGDSLTIQRATGKPVILQRVKGK